MGLLRSTRRLMGATLLAVGLAAGLSAPLSALAGFTPCRTDPVVTLSNGVAITLSATVYDAPSDIQNIAYVIHAPAGTTVTSVDYLGDPYASLESVQFYA